MPESPTRTTLLINDAVATAKNLPDLVTKVQRVDPAIAQAIEGKSLISSKTPIGIFLATGLGYLSVRYGFGWSDHDCELFSAVILLVSSYAMRYISAARITGIFAPKPITSTATSPGVAAT
jgi:ABC-type methionine transport system permease subunit